MLVDVIEEKQYNCLERTDHQFFGTLGELGPQLAVCELMLPVEPATGVFVTIEFLEVIDRGRDNRWDTDGNVGICWPCGGGEYIDTKVNRWALLATTLSVESSVRRHLVAGHFHILEHSLKVMRKA